MVDHESREPAEGIARTVENRLLWLGVILLAVALSVNEWFLAWLLGLNSRFHGRQRVLIFIFEIVVALIGTALIVKRRAFARILLPRSEAASRRNSLRRRLFALGFGLVSLAVLLATLEGVFALLTRTDDIRRSGTFTEDFTLSDDHLGFRPRRNVSATSRLVREGRLVYDVVYSFDSFGRRRTRVREADDPDRYALFFGGSFTFGEGVQGDETMPSYFAGAAPEYRSYNYAYWGYGPQQMLAKLETMDRRVEIPEEHGVAVYTFITHHIRRAIGSMSVTTGWGKEFPNYVQSPGAELVRRGSFATGRPLITRLYRLLSHSHTLRYFHVDLPPVLRDTHVQRTCDIIARARDVYREKFENNAFYVVIYPYQTSPIMVRKMTLALESRGIDVLDYSTLLSDVEEPVRIEGDGHPTPLSYRLVAERLTEDLRSRRGAATDK